MVANILNFFLKKGFDSHVKNERGGTGRCTRTLECVKLLIESRIDPNVQDKDGECKGASRETIEKTKRRS
ncbi:hypothetical protein LEP1GSC008_1486 [Leptospira kirschneri serovar Bulgarica str. Nikolaevo]|uniref:Ankyrin repeat protein n=2 Tax=Leptospira kirschneri TaxID=29507 RepID=A0A0E2B6I0_9LEPT|nr:hypothetical protein LEP1GSC081_1284 [Leptospira kirschneri str. H1]EMK25298.1 hypothetical protein LEP1GSC008_1486 [Leptospira kirschneri serovar Bulgarica str. Nikolaevo]